MSTKEMKKLIIGSTEYEVVDASARSSLALKANSADLKAVATTGLYSDLIGKPTIPTKVTDLEDASDYAKAATVGDLTYLTTDRRDNLVNAINEVNSKIGAQDVSSVNGKTGAVVLTAADVGAASNEDLEGEATDRAAAIAAEAASRSSADTNLQNQITALTAAVGSPLTASTAAAMTDTSKVYVYVGSEAGYTNGNWYYYNGTSWVSGGVYNSVAIDTDKTLSVSNKAADAKATGDGLISVQKFLDFAEETAGLVVPYNIFDTNYANTGYTSGWAMNKVIDTTTGDLTTTSSNIGVTYMMPVYNKKKVCMKYGSGQVIGTMRHVAAYDENGNFLELSSTNVSEYAIPASAHYVRVEHTYGTNTARLTNYMTMCDDTTAGTAYKRFFNPYIKETNDDYNSHDLLARFASYNDRDFNGVAYTWDFSTKTCTAVGTATSTSATNLFYNQNSMPSEIVPGKKYYFKCKTTDENLLLEMQTYDAGGSQTTFFIADQEVTIPSDTVGLLLRVRTRTSTTVNASITVAILNAKSNAELTEELSSNISNLRSNYIQIFPKFTTIGDSLMGGFMNRDGVSVSTVNARAAGNNWVNYLALRIGRTFTNLATGGSTAKQWREELLNDANIDTNCYIIGIGVNDKRQSLSVGSTADIAANFTNNADSFYGNYDFIIRQLMAWKPTAHLFCFTIPSIEGGTYADYNAAIREITGLYGSKVHCIDLEADYDGYYADPIVTDNYTNNHFNPLAYNYMSGIIEMAINEYMKENDAMFATAPYA